MCCVHVFPRAGLDRKRLMADAVRFGKGLAVNILGPAGGLSKRCYLRAAAFTARHTGLIDASAILRLRPLYDTWIRRKIISPPAGGTASTRSAMSASAWPAPGRF